ncbi:MAG: type ISP restriction/modification enzyme [Candidatus Thorarchaeota archaeon]
MIKIAKSSQEVTKILAQCTSAIKKQVMAILEKEAKEELAFRWFKSVKSNFIPELSIESFADMYAQTLTYGVFSARLMELDGFEIGQVSRIISKSNPFLEEYFTKLLRTRSSTQNPEEVGGTDPVCLLNDFNIEAVLEDCRWEEEGKDPILHYYERFLVAHNPDQRLHRGVFYTPDSVVSFIIRSVDHILRANFGFSDGLADETTIISEKGTEIPQIQIVDPATGTGAFLIKTIQEIKSIFDTKHPNLSEKQLVEKWNQSVLNYVLPRLSGCEVMLAPFAITHLRIGFLLRETHYDFSEKTPLRISFANALQSPEDEITAKEENDQPFIVVLGNPPYSVSSRNKDPWIRNLIREYKEGLNEKKINLDDDFIKFIRYGQWRIDQAGQGILAYVINNTFISALTHRMMRKSLLASFDEIYILDLHGNAMKQEKGPSGEKDENVFDIQQGVCIAIFVKKGTNTDCKVFHSDLYGKRKAKYRFLANSTISIIKWSELAPTDPYFFFVPKDFSLKEEYYSNISVEQIFKERTYGIQTKRDKIAICFSKAALKKIIADFIELPENTLREKYQLPPDGRDWKVKLAKAHLAQVGWNPDLVTSIHYRPFDYRFTYYSPKTKGFVAYPRYETMNHMLKENLGLICMRQVVQDGEYSHFGVTDTIVDERAFYSNRGGTYLFPLYSSRNNGMESNISETCIHLVETRTGLQVSPRMLFYYMYSIFFSRTYRERYSEFLQIDFPRLPVTSSKELFLALCQLGEKLVSLHLMASDGIGKLGAGLEGEGDNVVEQVPLKNRLLPVLNHEKKETGVIKINETQYFSNVPQEVWKFNYGGYQVCHKWLKDRKGRQLTDEEILHYQKILMAITQTLSIMREIDRITTRNGGWPLK